MLEDDGQTSEIDFTPVSEMRAVRASIALENLDCRSPVGRVSVALDGYGGESEDLRVGKGNERSEGDLNTEFV